MSTTKPAASGWQALLPNLVAGALVTLVTLSYSISYGTLVFSGTDLQPFLATGLHTALMTAWVIALAVAIGSSFPFSIAGPDSNATAILALMSAAIAASLTRQGVAGTEIVATVVVLLAVSAVLVGLLVYGLGWLGGGRLIRFLPYPVVGGFLAGTGYLVLSGGFKVLTGKSLTLATAIAPPAVPTAAWVTAIVVAFGLLWLPYFVKHFLVMPCVLVVGAAVFYVGLGLSGMDLAAARSHDMLFQPLPAGRITIPPLFSRDVLGSVRWDALLAEWQNFAAMTLVVVITILLNATGLDLATEHDVDFDRELRVNGTANVLSGLSGGMVGYLSISRSLLNFKAGARSRGAGIITALLCLGTAYIFAPAVAAVPRPVLAGLLIFLGLSMLREWLWDAFRKLPLQDYAMICTILLLIVLHGFIAGVSFGLLVASVFFAYNYSRTTCIKHTFTCSTHSSNKERPLDEALLIKEHGERGRALALQGFIFFGTSNAIVATCHGLLDTGKLRYLLLDFRLVQGLDASAVLSFTKLQQLCNAHKVELMLSGLREESLAVLRKTKFLTGPEIKVFPDIDHGMEWMEDCLIEETRQTLVSVEQPAAARAEPRPGATAIIAMNELRRILSAQFGNEALDVLIGYCETIKLEQGAPLFRRGDPGDSLYFIERGQVSVTIRLLNSQPKRLRTFGPGTIVGEMGLYSHQPRSADVFAECSCRVRKLSAENLARMEAEHPEVAVQFHKFVIRLLSSRLAAANEEIRSLL